MTKSDAPAAQSHATSKMEAQELSVWYDDTQALERVSIPIAEHRVTALIGPSGCGKSAFLRSLNRMNDLVPECRIKGSILLDGEDIYHSEVDPVALRRRVGMVFQKSNPFQKSIFENVAFGLRIQGISNRSELSARVEQALERVALWQEVKNRLNESGLILSGGQQQRLCIARALAVRPEVILMDEPASALDPIATARIEQLIHVLRDEFTIVIVTHSMQQAARVSDFTAFFYSGEMVEYGATQDIFTRPQELRTEEYITGRFG